MALLIAGGLIGFVVVLLKSNGASDRKEQESTPSEQVTTNRADELTRERTQPKRKRRSKAAADVNQCTDNEVTPKKTVSPREEPYDELLDDVGQYGERPAKKDGQWGLWRKGRWMILPVYDEIEVYKDGRAHVSVNGNSYDIDRNGDRIRQ